MHHDFQAHLRADGKGIDYTPLLAYDTAHTLVGLYGKQHGYVRKMLSECIQKRDGEACEKFVIQGEKLLYHLVDPDLVQMAKKVVFEVTGKVM